MTNRRQFLRNASLLAATGVCANELSAASLSAASGLQPKKSFGLQTYSLTVNRDDREFSSNVPGGLKRLAQMGYTTLELAGYNPEGKIGDVSMADFKKYADDAGLKILSSHVGSAEGGLHTRNNLQAHLDHWKKVAGHHAAIGCKYVIQPGQPTSTRSTEEVALVGDHYNKIGEVVKAAGLTFGYHNHSGEFQRVVSGGQMALPFGRWPYGRLHESAKMIMDGLLEVFDPSLVVFELDVYWCVMGMQDPVAWIKKYPKHIRVLHIKDVSVLGESGMMNFQKIFETAYANGIAEFFVELENMPSGGTQFEGVKGCADYLMKAAFVK